MVIEAVGVSQLVLIVGTINKSESVVEPKNHPNNYEKGYLVPTWEMIDGNVLTNNGIQEPLMFFVDKKIRIKRLIHDLYKNGLYLCRETDCEVYFSSDQENYLELRDKDGNKLTIEIYQ